MVNVRLFLIRVWLGRSKVEGELWISVVIRRGCLVFRFGGDIVLRSEVEMVMLVGVLNNNFSSYVCRVYL